MKNYLIFLSLTFASIAIAQNKKTENWQTLNPATDHIMGTGAEEAYKTLAGKTSKTVIVAVIDSGVDPNHEDLKDIIWTNPGEIPDNNIDDDHNGYIDDVHGWNFLGGANGDIADEATELARIYQRLSKKFKTIDTNHVPAELQKEYAEFKKIRATFVAEQTEKQQDFIYMQVISSFIEKVKKQNGTLN